jgi:hypothetical protein
MLENYFMLRLKIAVMYKVGKFNGFVNRLWFLFIGVVGIRGIGIFCCRRKN